LDFAIQARCALFLYGKRSVNLIPFNDGYFSLSETILNVIVFVPLGIYAGVLFKRLNFGAQFFSMRYVVHFLKYFSLFLE